MWVKSTRIVVDTREGVFGEAGDAVAAKDVVRPDDVNELSAVVAGKASGRKSDDEITLFKSVGTGIQDIALASVIFRNAKARGMHACLSVPLMVLGHPIGALTMLSRQIKSFEQEEVDLRLASPIRPRSPFRTPARSSESARPAG